jgi:ADP-ribose pyrophosphatase YjhB (NUDIX family)
MSDPHMFRIAASMLISRPDGCLLLLREGDPRVLGKLNLPGGHLEEGEGILDCAKREAWEETGLVVEPTSLLCIYRQGAGINFIFLGHTTETETTPGEDILSCHWFSPEDILALPDDEFLHATKMRETIADYLSGRTIPLDALHDPESGNGRGNGA